MRWKTVCLSVLLLANPCLLVSADSPRNTGLWDVERILSSSPSVTRGKTIQNGKVQVTDLLYESEPYQGRPTKVFAYFAHPDPAKGPYPAMLLVHGGGGKAFPQWAQLWAERGYAALAMDLAGAGADGRRLPDGGPPQDDVSKFNVLEEAKLKDAWSYQAVSAVLRGHAMLNNQQGLVDKDRIGITGVSWGGYLTCIVAGVDDQLKVAVPVYGCGYLEESSYWQSAGVFDKMQPDDRRRWLRNFDPSNYLPGVKRPILFVNGTNDFAYPLDSYKKCYQLVQGPRTLCVTVNMPHGHEAGWAPREIGAFVDSVLKKAEPLAKLSAIDLQGSAATVHWESPLPITKAELHFTSDAGPWKDRRWTTLPAQIDLVNRTIAASLPNPTPGVFFLTAVDSRGLVVSTEHIETSVK